MRRKYVVFLKVEVVSNMDEPTLERRFENLVNPQSLSEQLLGDEAVRFVNTSISVVSGDSKKLKKVKKGPKELAKSIVGRILDHGLAMSTWRDNNSSAYEELLWYRVDIEASAEAALKEG